MTTPVIKARRMYDYQNDTLQERTLVATAGDATGINSLTNNVIYWDAIGNVAQIFNPENGARNPRGVNSRDYMYFEDGVADDLLKWEITTGVSKWGIAAPTSAISSGVPTGGGGASTVVVPTTDLNGWGSGAHVGSYEGGVDQGFAFGTDSAATSAYSNPGNAFDGDDNTFASAAPQHTHTYYGCVWKFTDATLYQNITLNINSEVPPNGTDGIIVTKRSAGIWYSLDGGTTWVQVYNQALRPKQYDHIALANNADLTQIKVMAFTDGHDDMYHKVYEIKVTATTFGNGPVTLTSGRRYYAVFHNSVTGNYSDVSPISASTGPITGGVIPIINIPTSTDPQVDFVDVLATADGGDPSILYFVVEVANGVTTASDGIPEDELLLGEVYFFTDTDGNEFGVIDNQPPPVGIDFPIKHRGRIWAINGQFLQFSKDVAELVTPTGLIGGRYEEDWPPNNQLDMSEGAEIGRGLYSDGQTLYIGTSRHIRRVLGDSPDNFVKPEVVFNEVGLLTQNVWQTVFLEGTPVGTMWVTPDYRVILSDFNTYNDVGTEIQTTLNSTNRSQDQKSWAMFVADGPYSFYLLALPTGANTEPDTYCVYDMHMKKWFTWTLADTCISGIFYMNLDGVPRWVFVDSNGIIRIFDKTLTNDRNNDSVPVAITTTIQTSWLDFGDPTLRKSLNEVETETDITSTLVSVDAATRATEFLTPQSVVASAALVTGTFNDLKTYLAAKKTIDRFYRAKWISTSSGSSTPTDLILGSFSIEALPIHRI